VKPGITNYLFRFFFGLLTFFFQEFLVAVNTTDIADGGRLVKRVYCEQ